MWPKRKCPAPKSAPYTSAMPPTQQAKAAERLSGDSTSGHVARIGAQPGPAGRTFMKNRQSVSRSVGSVQNAVASHTAVVTAIVASRPTWLGIATPRRSATNSAAASRKELAIALISLHALIRQDRKSVV